MNDLAAMEFTAPSIEELAPLFPQYHFKSFIAEGGMGAVYRAVQTRLDREVAIKILPRELSADARFKAGFETEARAMAKLIHPNLVSVFDFGEVDGMLFLTMEFVDGQSLFEAAHGQAVDQIEAAHTIQYICEGLAHAHKKGIIHRDIKPANILIDGEGIPKVADFGLAGPMNESGDGMIMGTPYYTAPEVVSRAGAVDQKADIYSVCVMLYELLTGILPKDGYLMPSKVNDTDAHFDEIIRRGLHPNPAFRVASARELIELLDQAVASVKASGGAAAGMSALKAGGVLSGAAAASKREERAAAGSAKVLLPGASGGGRPPARKAAVSPGPALAPAKASKTNPVAIVLTVLLVGGGLFGLSRWLSQDAAPVSGPAAVAVAPVEAEAVSELTESQPEEGRVALRGGGKARFGSTLELEREGRELTEIKNQLLMFQTAIRYGDREKLPAETEQVGGRYFLRLDQPMTWFEAQAFCEKFGAQLACLHGEATPEWISKSRLGRAGEASLFWTGAYSHEGLSNYVWIDGETFDYESSRIRPFERGDQRLLAYDLSTRRFVPRSGVVKLPFWMEWKSDELAPGNFKAQLKRVKRALDAGKAPLWPVGTVSVDGVHLLCLPGRLRWQSARFQAEEYGAQLARVDSEAKLEALAQSLRLHLGANGFAWTAGRFELGEGWSWLGGDGFEFAAWAPGEPARLRGKKVALCLEAADSSRRRYEFKAADADTPVEAYVIAWGQ